MIWIQTLNLEHWYRHYWLCSMITHSATTSWKFKNLFSIIHRQLTIPPVKIANIFSYHCGRMCSCCYGRRTSRSRNLTTTSRSLSSRQSWMESTCLRMQKWALKVPQQVTTIWSILQKKIENEKSSVNFWQNNQKLSLIVDYKKWYWPFVVFISMFVHTHLATSYTYLHYMSVNRT